MKKGSNYSSNEHGLPLYRCTERGSALGYVSFNRRIAVVKTLLDVGASGLSQASRGDEYEELKRRAAINFSATESNFCFLRTRARLQNTLKSQNCFLARARMSTYGKGRSCLSFLAKSGLTEGVTWLLQVGSMVDGTEENGQSPLSIPAAISQ